MDGYRIGLGSLCRRIVNASGLLLVFAAVGPRSFTTFQEIIKNVVMKFPDPAGWHLMQLLKSVA